MSERWNRQRVFLFVAEVSVGVARRALRVIPGSLKKRVDDGIFHYIFQKTRVENDAYGWRPPEPGKGDSTTKG